MKTVRRKTTPWCLLLFFLLLILGSLPGWGAEAEAVSGTGGSSLPQNNPVQARTPTYQDYARLIAGLSNRDGALAAYEDKPAWANYARLINQSWARFDQRQLAPMREWISQELPTAGTATVFYPFSGPDFINLYTLFPHARTYLMVAMEPVGEIPDFSALDEQTFFAQLQRSLYDLIHLNFFITNKLETQLGKQELDGILPVLLFFLAREQTRILEVRYWVMQPDGAMAEVPALGGEQITGAGVPGVRIVFARAGSAPQTLYYFRFNLRDNSWKRHANLVSFLKSFGPLTTFAKAASYLMFKPHYAGIRQFILDQSRYVLQTDSAIPLRHFDPSVWNLRFYGTYQSPIPRFKCWFQKDMDDIYKKGQNVAQLPFGIGYRFRRHTSNLMLAAKKGNFPPGDSH
jgi:hypothetical protein